MKAKRFVEGAIIGTIAGAIGGVLFAPKGGKETRKDLVKAFNGIKSKVIGELRKANDFTKETYDSAVNKAISGYKKAKKIMPEDAAKINEIFNKSFADVSKVINKDIKNIAKAAKKPASKKRKA